MAARTGPTPPKGETPLERLMRDAQAAWRGSFGQTPSGHHEKRLVLGLVALLLGLWVVSGVYRVNSDELGVVLRLANTAVPLARP